MPAVEQDPQPAQAGRPRGVAQHVRPARSGSVAWMETKSGPSRSVEHPLEVELGEAGERREVPVEEGEPVVVVLQVQAAAHALGQLVDEAERAVVVAGADPVEDGRGHLDPERLARLLATRTGAGRARAGRDRRTIEVVGLVDQLAGTR